MNADDRDRRAVKLFLGKCSAYCDINALKSDWEIHFRDQMVRVTSESRRDDFKRGFALAVTRRAVSARDYERRTGWDFDTEEEYREHLQRLWSIFYGDESPEAVLE